MAKRNHDWRVTTADGDLVNVNAFEAIVNHVTLQFIAYVWFYLMLIIIGLLTLFVAARPHREHCDYANAPLCYHNGHAHCDTEGMK